MSTTQLPSDTTQLRTAVRGQVHTLFNHSVNRDAFVQAVEIIAVEARAAGIRDALALVHSSQLTPPPGTKIFQSSPATLYIDGYRHAVGDVMELLALEASGD